jgi:hypothetical protein
MLPSSTNAGFRSKTAHVMETLTSWKRKAARRLSRRNKADSQNDGEFEKVDITALVRKRKFGRVEDGVQLPLGRSLAGIRRFQFRARLESSLVSSPVLAHDLQRCHRVGALLRDKNPILGILLIGCASAREAVTKRIAVSRHTRIALNMDFIPASLLRSENCPHLI